MKLDFNKMKVKDITKIESENEKGDSERNKVTLADEEGHRITIVSPDRYEFVLGEVLTVNIRMPQKKIGDFKKG
jgi:hypothetical protein